MKKLEELKELLIVVDMVNGFVKEGDLADSYINNITQRIEELIREFQSSQSAQVAFIKDAHKEGCMEFKKFPVHCVDGTHESEIIDELKSYSLSSLVYKKNSRSAMFAPGFVDDLTKMKELRKVVVTGCCTDLCVMDLAIPMINYFDGLDRDVEVIVPEDAVETYDAPWHDRQEYRDMAFRLMSQEGVKLVKTLGGVSDGK